MREDRAAPKLGDRVPVGDACPACRAASDWHPDPSGPNGETWWICEACGLMRDHTGVVVDAGNHAPNPIPTGDTQ